MPTKEAQYLKDYINFEWWPEELKNHDQCIWIRENFKLELLEFLDPSNNHAAWMVSMCALDTNNPKIQYGTAKWLAKKGLFQGIDDLLYLLGECCLEKDEFSEAISILVQFPYKESHWPMLGVKTPLVHDDDILMNLSRLPFDYFENEICINSVVALAKGFKKIKGCKISSYNYFKLLISELEKNNIFLPLSMELNTVDYIFEKFIGTSYPYRLPKNPENIIMLMDKIYLEQKNKRKRGY